MTARDDDVLARLRAADPARGMPVPGTVPAALRPATLEARTDAVDDGPLAVVRPLPVGRVAVRRVLAPALVAAAVVAAIVGIVATHPGGSHRDRVAGDGGPLSSAAPVQPSSSATSSSVEDGPMLPGASGRPSAVPKQGAVPTHHAPVRYAPFSTTAARGTGTSSQPAPPHTSTVFLPGPSNGPKAGGSSGIPTGTGPSSLANPPAPTAPAKDPHEASTQTLVAHLFARTPALPGAVSSTSAPVAALAKPWGTLASANAVYAHGWWTAPGTVTDAISYLHAHVPSGLSNNGSTIGGPAGDPTAVRGVVYQRADTGYAAEIDLTVLVVADGTGVAVRADAEAIWVPTRPAAEKLPGVTSVRVTVRDGNKQKVRTLTGAKANGLAAVVRSLPVLPPATYTCPMPAQGTRPRVDRLVFTTSAGRVVVREDAGDCAWAEVRAGGAALPTLQDGSLRVDQAVRHLLGLAKDF